MALLEHDRRWEFFSIQMPDGTFREWTEELLQMQLDEWAGRLPGDLDPSVVHLLDQSRALVRHAWYRYEFLPEASFKATQAVEAHLSHRLTSRVKYEKLIVNAVSASLLTEQEAVRLTATRQVRNHLAHPKSVILIGPPDALGTLQWCHEIITITSARRRTEP